MSAYEINERVPLESPVLLLALDGWVDAGFGMAQAVEAIIDQTEPTVVATFDPDQFIDYRARRPIMEIVDGVNTSIGWPSIELLAVRDLDDNDLLILRGSEPDSRWRRFVAAVSELIVDLEVHITVTLGAYPAAVPHTRPVRITSTATAAPLVDPTAVVPGRLEIPAGIQAAIERSVAEAGIPAIGTWAQVPHYAATLPYPDASARLITSLAERGKRRFDPTELLAAGVRSRGQLDEFVNRSDEHRQLVEELESLHDNAGLQADLPTGDELAAELQRFLRDNEDD
ncbi:MAG: PAC2 family protein [Acidimicrobiia bacterium]|nr:PAC2 family protein [Acidimicrobiia bacterium]